VTRMNYRLAIRTTNLHSDGRDTFQYHGQAYATLRDGARTFHGVYLMCVDLPEGCQFRISDRCREKDLELFRDIVKTLIAEQPYDKYAGQLELSDDMEYVRRTTGV